MLRGWLNENVDQPRNVRFIKAGYETKSCKLALDTLHDLIRTGECNLILVASLNLVGGAAEVIELLELAARSRTRVIAVHDEFDTAETDWRVRLMFIALKQWILL
jgi:hypothetical protein